MSFDIIRCDPGTSVADARKSILVGLLGDLVAAQPTYRGHTGVLRINTRTLRRLIEDDMICDNIVRRWAAYAANVKAEA